MILYGNNYCVCCNDPFKGVGRYCDECIMLEAIGE